MPPSSYPLLPDASLPPLHVFLGESESGPLTTDLATSSFVLGGGPGSGKTYILSSLLFQLSLLSPRDLDLRIIDRQHGELACFADLPITTFFDHESTFSRPVTSPSSYEDDALYFTSLVAELDRRQALASSLGVADLASLRALSAEPLPHILTVVDDAANTFCPPASFRDRPHHQSILASAELLARKGPLWGITALYSTQSVTDRSLPYGVRSQCRVIGLATASQMSSLVLLDAPGLEDIRRKGEGVFRDDQGRTPFLSYSFPPTPLGLDASYGVEAHLLDRRLTTSLTSGALSPADLDCVVALHNLLVSLEYSSNLTREHVLTLSPLGAAGLSPAQVDILATLLLDARAASWGLPDLPPLIALARLL